MAKLMLIGEVAHVEITQDEENECWLATCVKHEATYKETGAPVTLSDGCGWMEHYYTLSDTTEYASDHADKGRE